MGSVVAGSERETRATTENRGLLWVSPGQGRPGWLRAAVEGLPTFRRFLFFDAPRPAFRQCPLILFYRQ